MMRRYKMLKLAAGPDGVLQIGSVHELEAAVGDAFVACEAAVCLDSEKETATRSAPETATGRGQRGRPKPPAAG
jgi:hypothetical protein